MAGHGLTDVRPGGKGNRSAEAHSPEELGVPGVGPKDLDSRGRARTGTLVGMRRRVELFLVAAIQHGWHSLMNSERGVETGSLRAVRRRGSLKLTRRSNCSQ